MYFIQASALLLEAPLQMSLVLLVDLSQIGWTVS